MTQKKQFRKRMMPMMAVAIIISLAYLTTTFVLSIKPPEGNPTLGNINCTPTPIGVGIASDSDKLSEDIQPIQPDEIYNFLLAGTDAVSSNTDTIMVLSLNVTDKKINVLSIPRDTIVNSERAVKKINAAYELGGITQFEQEVSGIIGFNLNRYILVSLKGVEKLIDAIGGIDFNIPQNMDYDDPMQDLHIHLKKGQQHLNGNQVVKLARFRHGYTNGDIGRISIQQELIKVIAEQAFQPKNITRIPEIINLVMENVETDLTAGQMLWLANAAKDIQLAEIHLSMVPGSAQTVEGLSYWLPNKNELLALINDEIQPTSYPIEDLDIVQLPENEGK